MGFALSQENIRLQTLPELDHEYEQLPAISEHRAQLHDECKRYWNIWSQLALDNGLIVYGCRLLIPFGNDGFPGCMGRQMFLATENDVVDVVIYPWPVDHESGSLLGAN